RRHGPGPLTLGHLGAMTAGRGWGCMLEALALCPPGTRLRLLREDGEWCQVDLKGDGVPDGFVHAAFLRRIGA
ncbi:MAG: hypothetical protein ACK4ST_07830, partial [Elioraea tepidiphila]